MKTLSIAGGTKYGNAKDSNLYLLYGSSEYNLDLVRHFHISKSINPLIGVKNPTIFGRSQGLSSIGSMLDFLVTGSKVSGSIILDDIFRSNGGGFRINYKNIDYIFVSSSRSFINTNQYKFGDNPIEHVYVSGSRSFSQWVSIINSRSPFISSYTFNGINHVLSITSSEDIEWPVFIYTGSDSQFTNNSEPKGGHLYLTLRDEDKPYFAIDDWAPLGYPLNLNGKNTKSSSLAPRADYCVNSPNTDHHGIDNGFNFPFNLEFVYTENNTFKLPTYPYLKVLNRAAEEEASAAGVIVLNSGGNDWNTFKFKSCSSDDPFYNEIFNTNITIPNPTGSTSLTGHPYNSYFTPYIGPYSGSKIYYLQHDRHHSVINTGNVLISSVKGTNEFVNYGDGGNHIDCFLYGQSTRGATAAYGYDSFNSSEFIPTHSYYENVSYNKNTIIDYICNFTESFNNSVLASGLPLPPNSNLDYTLITSSDYFFQRGWPWPSKDISTMPIEYSSDDFGGTSASNPLLMGFIAGYLEKHPRANVNDVRNWIKQNSITLVNTGSTLRNPFDGFFYENLEGAYPTNNGIVWVSGSEVYRNNPFNLSSFFIFPYTDLEFKLKMSNIRITKT
jgi:hypothetical protein